jgi:adenylosuccinate lyase
LISLEKHTPDMIERYTLPEMAALWTRQAIFETWLTVELAVLEVQERMGLVPMGVTAEVRAKAAFDIDRIDEIEAEVRHDVIAFLTNVAEHVGDHSRFVHLGMTSSDLIDTALALQVQNAGTLIMAAELINRDGAGQSAGTSRYGDGRPFSRHSWRTDYFRSQVAELAG